jgi:hypothetical protein
MGVYHPNKQSAVNDEVDMKIICLECTGKNRKGLFLIILLIALLGLIGCKTSTKPDTGSLSGSVILENDTADPALDPTDNAGVRVSLFKTVELDTTLVRLNEEYPEIGVILDQELGFDPAASEPMFSTTTDAAGKFIFKEVPAGSYNLIASKDGWGTIYRYNINVVKNNTSSDINITMYPLVVLGSYIDSPITFKQDHTYNALSDVTIVGSCSFLGKSRIKLAQNVQISILGQITSDIDSDYTHFTPLDNGSRSGKYQKWNTIKILSDNQTLHNMVCWGAYTGISLLANDCTVSNSYFRVSDNGIYAGATRTNILNCLFESIASRATLYDQSAGSGTINHTLENNIVYKCLDGLRTQGQAIRIKNNYFISNGTGIFSFGVFYHIIENNNFDQNENAIICTGTRIPIRFNNFFANPVSIDLSRAWYGGVTQPTINNNNFYQSTGFAIKVLPLIQSDDFDATLNYWKTTDIDDIVYDNLDYAPILQRVIYLPKRSQPVANCGIQLNE